MSVISAASVFCLCLAASDSSSVEEHSFGASAQLTTWAEYDTNAARVPSGELIGVAPKNAPRVVADGLMRNDGHLLWQLKTPWGEWRQDSAYGMKLFVHEATERMVVAQTRARLTTDVLPLGLRLTLTPLMKARAQLSGRRTYSLFRGDTALSRPLLLPARMRLTPRLGLSGVAFLPADTPTLSAWTGTASSGLFWAWSEHEGVDVQLDLYGKHFPNALQHPAKNDGHTRFDQGTGVSLSFSSTRRVLVALSYAFLRNTSNTRAESFSRHRTSVLLGFQLPQRITCSAQGALQLTSYDDGVSLGQRYFLGDDEENQNMLELQLARPLLEGISIIGRASLMTNELAAEGARFYRQTAALGIRAEL